MHVVEPALFIITGVVGGHASGIGHHDGRPKAAGEQISSAERGRSRVAAFRIRIKETTEWWVQVHHAF